MKTNFPVLLAAFVGSSALLVSSFAQTTAGSGTGTGSSTSSTTTSTTATTANGLPTATAPTTVTTGLPATSTTTLPGVTTTTLPAATTTQLPTTSTGVLPATESALPSSINDTSANRATVSSDARVLNSTTGGTTANGSTTGMTTPTTGTQVSAGTTPLGPTDVGQFPISGTNNTVRGAADSTTTTTTTVSLPNAASRRGQSIATNPVTRVAVATPPPAPERETMPPSPGADQSWVPGHYTYVQGQWIWLSGKWTTPPTTGARWIEGVYDPATRLFTEGHWDLSSTALANPVR